MAISDETLDLQTFNLLIATCKTPQQLAPPSKVKLITAEKSDSVHDFQKEPKSDISPELFNNNGDELLLTHPFNRIYEQELQAIELVRKSQNVDQAVELLENVIGFDPGHAPAYNNLAQVYRIKLEQAGDDPVEKCILYEKAIVCLKKCLSLCEPTLINDKQECRILSSPQKTLLRQCYTQLSLVYLQMSREKDMLQSAIGTNSTSAMKSLLTDSWNLDSVAYKYLERARLYGNVFAEALAPYKNPYAQVCGQIVREALLHDLD